MDAGNWSPPTKQIPMVLTVSKVRQTLALMEGVTRLLACLLYGTGMRLREGLALRVKDIDFDCNVILGREGKGSKDRIVMLPSILKPALTDRLAHSRAIWTPIAVRNCRVSLCLMHWS